MLSGRAAVTQEDYIMKSSLASGLKKVFFVLITLLSMATSFLFFVEIFSFRGAVTAGDNMAIVSTLFWGAVGVLVLDGAALVWLKTYLGASDNNAERALATVGMVVGFVGSALSSLAYLILVAGNSITVDPSWGQYVTYAMAVIIVIHFGLVFLSSYKSTQAQIDERAASMLAEATDEMLIQTEKMFRADIPVLAKANADQLSNRLAARFTNVSFAAAQQQPPAANGQQALRQLAAMPPGGPDEIAQLRAMLAAYDAAGDDAAADDAMDLDALVDALVEERLRQERLAVAPAPGGNGNGNGANFTPRPGNGRSS